MECGVSDFAPDRHLMCSRLIRCAPVVKRPVYDDASMLRALRMTKTVLVCEGAGAVCACGVRIDAEIATRFPTCRMVRG